MVCCHLVFSTKGVTPNKKGETQVATDTKSTDADAKSVHNENLNQADVKTDSDSAKPFELHTGDRAEGTDPERFRAVRGVNPNTGANAGLIQDVAADEVAARLALAFRAMPVGSFQAFNGDLRTVEASCKAALGFLELFKPYGLEFKMTKPVPEDQVTPHPDTTNAPVVETTSGPDDKTAKSSTTSKS